MNKTTQTSNVLGLDVGEKRVGVALASSELKLTKLLQTLNYTDVNFWTNLNELLKANQIQNIVIGLPRGLDGQNTAQTKFVYAFAEKLKKFTSVAIKFQDEALTSVRAREILQLSGKPYNKSDVDAISASIILSDYLENLGTSK